MQQTTSGQPAAEARQVTILKCDIVESTRITGSLSLDRQLEFERTFHDLIKGLAQRFGAHMERFEGDGAFLILGLSPAREDAAKCALDLAHELVAEVGAWRFVPDEPLRLRVGVASGQVAAVQHSELHSIAGNTINRAQRLMQAAGHDEILLCDQTRTMAAGFYAYKALGHVPAKGFEGGINAWRLVAKRAVDSRFEATRSPGRILGREPMLEAIAERWRDALAGRPCLAWLCGDAGIGKSRLARAARLAAEGDDAVVLTLDCSPSTRNTPLFPVAVLLRRRAALTSEMKGREAVRRLRDLLSTLLPPDVIREALRYVVPLLQLQVRARPPAGSATEIQEKTIGLLVAIIAGLLADRPGFVLCEDLHWADDSTLRLVARLCARLNDRPVLILGASRLAPPDALRELPGLVELPVGPLDPETALELVRLVAGGAELADAAAIVERSEGVPLLIEELTRAALDPAAGDAPAGARAAGSVPLALQLVVESRLAQNPDLAAVAKTASALGREVDLPLLASLTDTDTATAGLLADAGLFDVAGRDGARARFRHAMICEAVYATVLDQERRAIHSRIADALLGPFAGAPDATPELLAAHLHRADRFREAIDIRLQAASDTAARGAFVECEGHCGAGILTCHELAKTDPAAAGRLEYQLTLQVGVALVARLGYSDLAVEEAYLRATAICPDDEAATLCPTMHGLAGFNLLRGRLDAAHKLAMRGLSLAERSGEIALLIDALSMLSYTSFYYRPHRETREVIQSCLDLYERHNGGSLTYLMPYDAATATLGPLPTVLWTLGDPAGAEAAFERCVSHIERCGRDIDVALMQGWLAGFRITQQRWRECEIHSEIGEQASGAFANWRDLSAISKAIGVAHRTRSPEDAQRAVTAIEVYEKSGAAVSVTHYCAGLARACINAGAPDLAAAMVEHGLKRSQESAESWMVPELTILKAELEQDGDKALTLLQQALQDAEAFGSVAMTLMACASLAERLALPEASLARETLALFAGAEPPEPDWMRPRLAVLRDAVRPLMEMTAA
jgi:class 3 adenylate cyclase